MTVLREVAFVAACSHLFTGRQYEFTCCNDTLTAPGLVRSLLAGSSQHWLMRSRLRSPSKFEKISLSSDFFGGCGASISQLSWCTSRWGLGQVEESDGGSARRFRSA